MRWWRELRDPALKCKRLGHKYREGSRRIRRETHEFRSVCIDYEQRFKECSRCGHWQLLEERELDRYTGVSMPSSWWDEMRENGFIVVR